MLSNLTASDLSLHLLKNKQYQPLTQKKKIYINYKTKKKKKSIFYINYKIKRISTLHNLLDSFIFEQFLKFSSSPSQFGKQMDISISSRLLLTRGLKDYQRMKFIYIWKWWNEYETGCSFWTGFFFRSAHSLTATQWEDTQTQFQGFFYWIK